MKRFETFLTRHNLAGGILAILLLFFAFSPMMAEKSPGRGFLGVSVEKLSADDLQEMNVSHGVRVTDVVAGEAAEKAGFQKGDVIQSFNQKKIETPRDLVEAVRGCSPKTEVTIKLVREKKNREISVVLGETKVREHFPILPDRKTFRLLFKGGPYLGVQIEKLNPDLAEYFEVKPDDGVLILQVEKDSPAEKAGLKAGDVIMDLNGKAVKSTGAVHEIVAGMEEGDPVEITIIRHGKKTIFKAVLGERPGFHEMNILKQYRGDRCRVIIPEIQVDIPDIEGCKVIIREKLGQLEKKLKEAEKKIRRKLQHINECICI